MAFCFLEIFVPLHCKPYRLRAAQRGGSGETLQSHVPSVFGAEHLMTRERHDAGCVNPIVLPWTRQCRSTATREVSGPQRRPLASAGGAVSCTISTAGHTGDMTRHPGGCRPPRKTRLGGCGHLTTRERHDAGRVGLFVILYNCARGKRRDDEWNQRIGTLGMFTH